MQRNHQIDSNLGHLLEWTFDRKRISPNPYPKAQKPFRENETTSFFGHVSTRYGLIHTGIKSQEVIIGIARM